MRRQVTLCFAPGVALTQKESSTMGHVVEQFILRDYYRDTWKTPPHAFEILTPTSTEWWDTGQRDQYVRMLVERHGVSERQVNKLDPFQLPDISTWKGEYRRKGQLVPGKPKDRNEYYEVKPLSVSGAAKGTEKILTITDNMIKLGIYEMHPGTWYPEPPGQKVVARKNVPIEVDPHLKNNFWFTVKRLLAEVKLATACDVEFQDIWLEIERRFDGLIYYEICIRISLECDDNVAREIAKEIVQRLYKVLTANLEASKAELELKFAASLVPVGADHKPLDPIPPDKIVALRQAIAEERRYAVKHKVVEELRDQIDDLRSALFTRLRGLPGERFLVCCDESFFVSAITTSRQLRNAAQLAKQIRLLQVRPPVGVVQNLALGGAMVRANAVMLATLRNLPDLMKLALVAVTVPWTGGATRPLASYVYFRTEQRWQETFKWLENHPAQTLLIGAAVVYGTAIVVASAGTTGAVAMYGPGVAASAGAAESTAGTGLVRALAPEGLKRGALPAVREVATREVVKEAAKREVDTVVKEALARIEREQVERYLLSRATAAARKVLDAKVIATVGAISVSLAMPSEAQAATPQTQSSEKTQQDIMEVGMLYLLRLKGAVTEMELPNLEEQIDYRRFSDDLIGPAIVVATDPSELRKPGSDPPTKSMRYLGLLECS